MRRDTIYLTQEGQAALEAERRELLTIRRPAVVDGLHDALTDGGTDDVGILDETKDELALIDARLREIEHLLQHAVLLPTGGKNGADHTVHLGSHIVVRDGDGDERTWVIVGSAEANPRVGKISNESPVGAALLGRKEGETAIVHALAGEITYTIVRVV